MMAKTGLLSYVLVALLAVLAGFTYVRVRPDTASTASPASPAVTAAQPSNQAARGGGRQDMPVTDVRLDALKAESEALENADRNPFRFKPKAPSAPPPSAAPPLPAPTFVAPPVVTGPPPPPPIPLRYVGLLGAVTQPDRVAVLSDARGNPFYGKEGDIIEGRYRVLRIAADSIDLAYADGRGRQTLRLSSQ